MESRGGRRSRRTGLWHEGFYELMHKRGARGFEHTVEYVLSRRPRRADMLLIRRTGAEVTEARVLRGLWPLLSQVTLLELKSPSRGFRRGDLLRLMSYGAQYHSEHGRRLAGAHSLTLALIAPRMNEALREELAWMRWSVEPVGNGYAHIRGAMYTTVVAFTNEVANAEADDLLRIFSEQRIETFEALCWLNDFFLEKRTMSELTEWDEHDEMFQKLLDSLPAAQRLRGIPTEELLRSIPLEERLRGVPTEERLRGVPPEERLRGVPTEERLRGVPPEERLRDLRTEEMLLALPDEVLRGLADDYIRNLPEHVQHAIRKRLAGR